MSHVGAGPAFWRWRFVGEREGADWLSFWIFEDVRRDETSCVVVRPAHVMSCSGRQPKQMIDKCHLCVSKMKFYLQD